MLIICSVLIGCTKDYDVKIEGVTVQGNEVYEDFSVSTEFLDDNIFLGANFSVDPSHGSGSFFGPRVGEVSVMNPVEVDKIVLTSNKNMIKENDTILAGSNLIDHFTFQRLQELFRLSYNFKATTVFSNETDYYKFYMEFELSDETKVTDSCLVKINF